MYLSIGKEFKHSRHFVSFRHSIIFVIRVVLCPHTPYRPTEVGKKEGLTRIRGCVYGPGPGVVGPEDEGVSLYVPCNERSYIKVVLKERVGTSYPYVCIVWVLFL